MGITKRFSSQPVARVAATREDWIDNSGRFIRGKHKGELAFDIVQSDRQYVQWIVNEAENIHEDDRDLLSLLLTQRGR